MSGTEGDNVSDPSRYFDWQGNPVTPPWPYFTQDEAAHQLGVTTQRIDGWANNPFPAVGAVTSSGSRFWLFQRNAIEAVVAKLAEGD